MNAWCAALIYPQAAKNQVESGFEKALTIADIWKILSE